MLPSASNSAPTSAARKAQGYMIFFRISAGSAQIVNVPHGSRNIEIQFGDS
jgi:hypothetical protein